MKQKLVVAFSGGRTSAKMAKWIKDNLSDTYEILFVYCNTGKEREESLDFVHKCDKEFGLNVVWIEAVTDPRHGKGVSAKVVTYETASRNGEPFEQMIAKHGIPNKARSVCSRELKTYAMRAYCRQIGWKGYWTAIGIRVDEIDRKNPEWKKERLLYPFISMHPTRKTDVNEWWGNQSFDLGVWIPKTLFDDNDTVFYKADNWQNGYWYKKPTETHRLDNVWHYWFQLKSYEGNCDICYKKSLRKLMTIGKENPQLFDWWRDMEVRYGHYVPDSQKHNPNIKLPNRFFRNHQSTDDILTQSQRPFEMARDESQDVEKWKQVNMFTSDEFGLMILNDYELDTNNGCEESCEPY
jgi:hypothetical protein